MEKDIIINGIHIGEHGFEPEKIIREIKERAIEPGFDFVVIRANSKTQEFPQEYYLDWARLLTENKIYFALLYSVQFAPKGRESRIFPETIAKVKEIAGEYFLGDQLGETGSMYACKAPGYYINYDAEESNKYCEDQRNYRIKLDCENLEEAHDNYVKTVKHFVDINRRNGMPHVLVVESTAFFKYDIEAGVDMPLLEIIPGSPDVLVGNIRGCARAFRLEKWGTYFCHEWYGGIRHEDTLKKKRLELSYKYAYLAGSQLFMLESGDEGVKGYGCEFGYDHEVCKGYRDVLAKMQKFKNEDERPVGGPKVKVAFVSGLYDGWAGKWGRSSLFNQFYREEWGYGEAEHSWMLLDELGTKRKWDDVANYGDFDTSALPAYGLYDIVPMEADVDALSRYDYLIFLGWNTMTEENMDKLTEYVRRGGHLLMTAAHLNSSAERGGKYKMISDEKVEELFGCRFLGEIRRVNSGVKFKYNSLDEKVLYPTYVSGGCDPLYSAGYADYARFATTDGKVIAFSSDSFQENISDRPMVIENKIGEGVATLVTSTNYPGNPSISLFYRAMMREMVSASARNCDIVVIGGDRLRYAVYEGDKIYLLNTDYDLPITVKVIKNGCEHIVLLEALEMKAL